LASNHLLLDLLNFAVIIDPIPLLEQMHTDTEMSDRVRIVAKLTFTDIDPAIRKVSRSTSQVRMGQLE
jgi:hypothetical protein